MNEREQIFVRTITERLRDPGIRLASKGWSAEIVVLAPEEIPRIPGYKVALVVSEAGVPPPNSVARVTEGEK